MFFTVLCVFNTICENNIYSCSPRFSLKSISLQYLQTYRVCIKMCKTFLFSIAVVFCFGTCFTSAKEVSDVDVTISQAERTDYTPVDTDVNKEFRFNGSELEMARADAQCSEERPCQNGGTCDWSKRCKCPYWIKGDLCEEVLECNSKCMNRLEVDCLYNQLKWVAYCSCKNSSLYYDQKAGVCKPCPCENGYCDYKYSYSDRILVCNCHSGYKEFNGYCKECDCGVGHCEFDSKGGKICKCFDGFYEREGRCRNCECHGWSDMETKCEVTGNMKRCFCKEGFQDVFGHCEDIDECETNNACHPSATCLNTFGSFECRCPEGYEGNNGEIVEPGEVCEDIDECRESLPACWYGKVDCVNLPGSYKCECLQGYEPTSYFVEPHKTSCVKTTKNAGPATIVVCTTLILMGVSCVMHIRLRKRALRLN